MRIWYRINGVDVPASSTDISLKNTNEFIVASWNFLDPYNAGDYFELMIASSGRFAVIQTSPATPPAVPPTNFTIVSPLVPGVILTAT